MYVVCMVCVYVGADDFFCKYIIYNSLRGLVEDDYRNKQFLSCSWRNNNIEYSPLPASNTIRKPSMFEEYLVRYDAAFYGEATQL